MQDVENERFRLIQDGQPVAWVEGNSAVAEILHYAAVYAQDGPVTIQKKVNGRWKLWKETPMTNDKDSSSNGPIVRASAFGQVFASHLKGQV